MRHLTERHEQSFNTVEELRNSIAGQDRQDYEEAIRSLALSKKGTLRTNKFEGSLTKSALSGLLKILKIPEEYGMNICPSDLLSTTIQRLAHDADMEVCIQTIDDVATGIMPVDRQPIRHDLLLDWLGDRHMIREATLTDNCLRIIALGSEPQELLPGDPFAFGWELITGEDGWKSTAVWRLAVRQVCTNGMIGFDRKPAFRRQFNSSEPVLKSLEELTAVITAATEPPRMQRAIE